MKNGLSFKYPILVWLATVIITAILLPFYFQLLSDYKMIDFGFAPTLAVIIFGFIFSIPAFIFYSLIFAICKNSGLNNIQIKLVCSFFAISIIFISFYCFLAIPTFIIPYIIITTVFGIILKI